MKNPIHNDPLDALGRIYENMYEHVVDNLHTAEDKTEHLAHKLIDEAKEKTIKIEKQSQKEAEMLAHYLKRDLSDTAHYLSNTGHELKNWLGFETALLESEFLDLLLKVADKTTVKLLQMKEESNSSTSFHTGEVTGPGTLVCDECGEKLYFYKAGKIPACSKCNAETFHRVTITPNETSID